MFAARNFDLTLVIFNNRPVRPDGWVKWVDISDDGTESFGFVLEQDYFPELKPYDEPIEFTLLPIPTIETIHTNPVYHSILDYGRDLRDDEICKRIFGKELRNPTNCKNSGHPWCREQHYCHKCEDWHYNIDCLERIVQTHKQNDV